MRSFKKHIEEGRVTPGDLKAQAEGKKAARKGQKYEENPYEKGSSRHLQWSKGHNAARAGMLKKEEAEQMDEISKDLAGRYKAAATKDKEIAGRNTERHVDRGDYDKAGKQIDRQNKRLAGIKKANKVLNKEEAELDENLNFMIPKGKAASDYMSRKAKMRQDQHKEQDPKHAKTHARNMVDMDKAAAKAKKKGVAMRDYGKDNWKVRNGVKRGKLPEQFELEEAKERYYAKDAKEMKLKGLALELASKIIKADGSINSYGVERIRKADNVTLRKANAWFDRVSKTKFTGQDFAHLMDMLPESVEQIEENWATKAMAGKSPLKKKYQAPKDGEEDRAKRMKKKMYGSMMGGLKKEEVELSEEEINNITAEYINENNITLEDLENMSQEQLDEIIGKAIGGAFKVGAKAAVGAGRLAAKGAKKLVKNKQGNTRFTQAAKNDAKQAQLDKLKKQRTDIVKKKLAQRKNKQLQTAVDRAKEKLAASKAKQ